MNELVDIICKIANKKLGKKYTPGPQGVRGRNADLSLCKKALKWEPKISLEEGLKRTYQWIGKEVREKKLDKAKLKAYG